MNRQRLTMIFTAVALAAAVSAMVAFAATQSPSPGDARSCTGVCVGRYRWLGPADWDDHPIGGKIFDTATGRLWEFKRTKTGDGPWESKWLDDNAPEWSRR